MNIEAGELGSRRPRTLFFGTPATAVPLLEALVQVSDVVGVVTRPDRARGRSRRAVPSPVADVAEDSGLSIIKPAGRAELADIDLNVDIAVVVAFGMIIPEPILAGPTHGMINVHYSLLPRWRGAAPVERAIQAGDSQTGVCIMQMDAGLDTGPVLARWDTAIGADETAGALTDRLSAGAAELLESRFADILEGRLTAEPQQESGATYAHRIASDEARIEWDTGADEIDRHVRAFNPRPGAFTTWRGERFKIHSARPGPPGPTQGELATDGAVLSVGTGDGSLILNEVQPAGSRRMTADAWRRGVQGELGAFE